MKKMMKVALTKPVTDEKGQAFILSLILLLVGALIITPLLGLMSTGLIAGQALEEKMDGFYAADAGVEDALYNILTPGAPYYAALQELNVDESLTLDSIVVNGNDVEIVLTAVWTLDEFFEGLLGEGESSPSGHGDWAVVGDSLTAGTYTMTIEYTGSGNASIKGVGAWLQGTTYTFVELGPASNITNDYPNYTFNDGQIYNEGIAFIWEWPNNPDRPMFSSGDTMTLTFNFLPTESPARSFGWIDTVRGDIDFSTSSEDDKVLIITATATDSATGKQTEVIAYVSSQDEPPSVGIITWEIE